MLLGQRRHHVARVRRLGTAARTHGGHRSVVDVNAVRKSASAAQHMRDLMESDGGSRRVLAFSARGPHQSSLQQTMDAGLAFHELERRGHSLMSAHDWCKQMLMETGHEQHVVGFGKLVALLLMHTKDIPLERLHRVTSSMQLRKIVMDLVRYFQLLEAQGVTPAVYEAFASSSGGESLELQMHRVAQMELANAYRVYRDLLIKYNVTSWDGLVLEMLTKVDQPSLPETAEFLNAIMQGFTDLVVDDLQAMTPAMVQLLAHLRGSPLIQSSASFSHVLQPTEECPRAQLLEQMLAKHYDIATTKRVVGDADQEMLLQGATLEIRQSAFKILDRSKNDSMPTSPAISCLEFYTVTDEERAVVQDISDRLKSHQSPQEIAVLCATYADAERMTQCLCSQGIPVSNRSYGFASKRGTHLFDEPGVNTIVSLLIALCFPSDSAHLYNVLRSDAFHFPPLLLSKLMEHEHQTHASLLGVLEKFAEGHQHGIEADNDQVQKAIKFVELMKRLRSECHQRTAQDVVQVFLEETGRLPLLLNPSTPQLEHEAMAVADFLRELEIAQQVTQSPHIPFVVPYLLQLRETHVRARTEELSTDDVTEANDDIGVRVFPLVPDSLHSLSVACLYLVSMRDSQFPGRLKRLTLPLPYPILHAPYPVQTREEHLQSCERLSFQALTCARERVVISCTKASSQGKSSKQEKPSRIFASIWQTHDPEGDSANRHEGSSSSATPELLSQTPMLPDANITYDPKHLSYSQITEYQRCPQRYFLSRVMKLSSEASMAMIYGRALHEAIACFAGALVEKQYGRVDMEIAEQNAHAVLLNALTTDGQFRSEAQRDAVLAQGQLALDAFMHSQQDAEVLHVEHPFECEVPEANVTLRGIWDRIDQGSVGPVIQEFKSNLSGAKRDVRKAAAESLQLKLYMYAYERVFGKVPHGATLQIIGERNNLSKQSDGFVPYTPTIAQEVVTTIQEVVTAMRNGKFEPTPSYMECMFCPFATSACRAGRDTTLKADNALE